MGLAAGGLVAPPFARAQQASRAHRIGILTLAPFPPLVDPFLASLGERGWKQGHNLHVESRNTAAEQHKAADMARELITRGAELLAVIGTANAVAAKRASAAIPVVMLASGYPVQSGLAASLARPGGNVTGLTVYAGTEVFAKGAPPSWIASCAARNRASCRSSTRRASSFMSTRGERKRLASRFRDRFSFARIG